MRAFMFVPAVSAILLTATACGENSAPAPTAPARLPPAEFLAISGTDQIGLVGETLEAPLVVRVRDSRYAPVPNAVVSFAVVSGGGSVQSGEVRTDFTGHASTVWTLGAIEGEQRVTASVEGVSPLTFEARAVGEWKPASIHVISGDWQIGRPGEPLRELVVRVLDQRRMPIGGAEVLFEVEEGDGVLLPALALTKEDGLASSELTLGTSPGETRVTATVAGAGDVVFRVRAVTLEHWFDLKVVGDFPVDGKSSAGTLAMEGGEFLAWVDDGWVGQCVASGGYLEDGSQLTFLTSFFVDNDCPPFTRPETIGTLLDGVLTVQQQLQSGTLLWRYELREQNAAAR